MKEVIGHKNKISWTTKMLALYFALMPLDFVDLEGIGSVSKIVAILPIICFLLESRGRFSIRGNNTSKWLIAFTVWAVISMAFTININTTWKTVETLLLNVAMILVLADCKLYTKQEKEYLKKALVIGSIFAAVVALVLGLSGNNFYEAGRYTLTLGDVSQDPNMFCGFLLFGFTFFFSNGFIEKPVLNFSLAFLFIGVSLVSGSRGGFLAFIVCAFAVFALSGKEESKSKLFLMALAGIVIGILFLRFALPLIDPDLLSRFSINYIRLNGTTNRFKIWESLFNSYHHADILRKIIGHGYGTCPMLSYDGMHAAHNVYIDNLLTIGIIGVFLQIGFQISGLKTAMKNHSYYYASLLWGMICMCMSLSLLSYKPLWAVIMMIIIEANSCEEPVYAYKHMKKWQYKY